MVAGEPIAAFNDAEGLRQALRARWQERGYSIEHASEIIGLPARFLNKVLSINPSRDITLFTLGPILQGFGVRLLMVDDPEAIARFENRIKRRDQKMVRSVAVHYQITSRHVRRIGAKGGANSRKYMSARQASQLGRKAANARWGRTAHA